MLLEMSAFMDFLVEHITAMKQEWAQRRAELVAAGELPEQPERGGRS